MANILYGDGIHDDTAAIQEMIDKLAEVALPEPKAFYLISKPLELHSNCRLVLPRFAEIRLAKDSNCYMLKNKTVTKRHKIDNPISGFGYTNMYSPDAPCHNIEVVGGIWNCNNIEQKEKSDGENLHKLYNNEDYEALMMVWRFGFLFYNVKNLRISSLTIKNPVRFGITMDTISYFTVDNIVFDYNTGRHNKNGNMDGIHMNGNCHFGQVTNLKGTCYDDLLAFNAEEGSNGDITNIDVRGIYSENCHSAIRLLNVTNHVENIHISEIHGTYYTYCIGITKFYKGKNTGYFDGITIDNVTASKAAYDEIFQAYGKEPFPIISIEDVWVKNMRISNMYRKEYNRPFPSIEIQKGAEVENLVLDNITYENHTGEESMPMFVNNGTVKHLDMRNIIAKSGGSRGLYLFF